MIGPTRMGMISGRITDKNDGKPLFGVKITVQRTDITVRTDIRGRFTIPNLEAGDYFLRCEREGYRTLSALRVKVVPGRVTPCECQLVPKERIHLDEPVVLLPLLLEIREHMPHNKHKISVAKYALKASAESATSSTRFAPFEAKSVFEPPDIQERQYWIRWYPDEPHYLTPVGKITEEEKTAWEQFYQVYKKHEDLGSVKGLYAQDPHNLSIGCLEIFYGISPGRLTDDEIERCKEYDEAARKFILDEEQGVREALGWQDTENPDIKSAWIEFAKAFGPVRARQIAKHMLHGNWDFDTGLEEDDPIEILMDLGMSIPTLPEEISLYTIKDGEVELLVDRIAINRDNLIIAPTDLEGSHWMTDFQKTIQEGMGTIISDPEKVAQIDGADWLIVVGLNETPDSRKVFEEILRRNSANGELAILAQDSPTNNAESASTQYTALEVEAEKYLRKTRMRIPPEDAPIDPSAQLSENTLDAHRLTSIFKLATCTLSHVPEAGLAEMTEAAAMAALLWTPCTLLFLRTWDAQFKQSLPPGSQVPKVFSLGDFFIHNVRARGTLPIIRIGENPYGILPVISLRDWGSHLPHSKFLSGNAKEILVASVNYLKDMFLKLSEDIPKVDPSDDDVYEKLLEILRCSPVSKRVDVRPFDSDKPYEMTQDSEYLDCPLVKDKVDGKEACVETPYPETAYLCDLSRVNQSDFDPACFQIDEDSPLLERIMAHFLWLIFEEAGEPSKAAAGIKIPGGLDLVADAASLLKRVHPDKLEILLVETLDLFSHRLDAWLTGLANSRLVECQRENTKSPPTGVYGWLEKPGQLDSTLPEPEFVQAPSVKQATTAAILRNASIHNGTDDNSGAFQINLSSEQVRKGLWYLEGLRQGHQPGELLGYRLERMIHEASNSEIKETDIFELRKCYPLTLQATVDEEGELTSSLTIIDGEKFLKDEHTLPKFNEIKARLNQIQDAAADIALCEVIHADDNVARRGGWLDFIGGDGQPPSEVFIRSLRTGDIHGMKIFLLISPPENLEADESVTNPRIIADPVLAHFCETLMPDFGSKEIVANLTKADGSQTRPITFYARELNMDPIDFVMGGIEEIKLRIRYYLLSCWKANDPTNTASAHPCSILGPFPDFEKADEQLNEVGVDIVSPMSTEDTSSVFSSIEKAKLIRNLIHQHRSKNSLGTVHPQDLPIVAQDQLEKLDPLAGFELLSRRLRRIREQLVSLISGTVRATSDLKRRHLILQGLRECRRSVQLLKEKVQSNANETTIDATVDLLKAKVINLIDSDPDFKGLAEKAQLLAQIDQIKTENNHLAERVENLRTKFLDLEKRFGTYIESTAKVLVASAELPLFEISRFGLEKALTVLPDEPTVAASMKMVKLFDQLIASLIDKLNPLISGASDLQNYVHCLKVVYLNAAEINQILQLNGSNWAGADNRQLRDRLPLTEAQSQIILAEQFQDANYFEPLLKSLVRNVNSLTQIRTYYEDYLVSAKIVLINDPHGVYNIVKNPTSDVLETIINAYQVTQRQAEIIIGFKLEDIDDFDVTSIREVIASTTDSKTAEVISLLQAATDKEGMVILTPYLLQEDGGHRPDWTLDFSQLVGLSGPTYLQEYQKVRPAIANIFELFNVGSELSIYEDKRYQRLDPAELSMKKEGNTDYLYLTRNVDSTLNVRCPTFLLIDQWQEGIPNPDQSEITGVALRYESPQAEAPNAIIIAVPPYKSSTEIWGTDLLANTLLETIELMQIRMLASDEVTSHYLPALLFPPTADGERLFPSRKRLLHGFDIGPFTGYVPASQLSKEEMSMTKPTAIRNEAPTIGGIHEY